MTLGWGCLRQVLFHLYLWCFPRLLGEVSLFDGEGNEYCCRCTQIFAGGLPGTPRGVVAFSGGFVESCSEFA